MKIALTGHTTGLGKHLVEQFGSKGYDLKCFTLSEGYDINSESGRQTIVEEAKDCDVFINNAYQQIDPDNVEFKQFAKLSRNERSISKIPDCLGQIAIFDLFRKAWSGDSTKRIVNMSSHITVRHFYKGSHLKAYWLAKTWLNDISASTTDVYVTNLKLGLFKSIMTKDFPFPYEQAEPSDYATFIVKLITDFKDIKIPDAHILSPNVLEGKDKEYPKKPKIMYADNFSDDADVLIYKGEGDPKKVENFLDIHREDSVKYVLIIENENESKLRRASRSFLNKEVGGLNVCYINNQNGNIDNLVSDLMENRYTMWAKWIDIKG